MKTVIMVMLSVIMFTACSSNNTPKTQYYLLNSPTLAVGTSKNEITKNEPQSTISVALLELPEYLAQPSLVLQLSDHQLHYSHFHIWAEPLKLGLAQALSHDLNSNDSEVNFIVNTELRADLKADIIIKISAFQATHQAQVILTGSYTINREKASPQSDIINNFNLVVDLKENGYPHAVKKMRQVTLLLAKDISANIAKS